MDCRMYVEAEVGKKVGPYALKPFCPPASFNHDQNHSARKGTVHKSPFFITAHFYCWSWLRRELGMSSAYVCRATLESILSARASF